MVPSLVLADILTNLQKKCLVCVGTATASCAGSAVGTQETMGGLQRIYGDTGRGDHCTTAGSRTLCSV